MARPRPRTCRCFFRWPIRMRRRTYCWVRMLAPRPTPFGNLPTDARPLKAHWPAVISPPRSIISTPLPRWMPMTRSAPPASCSFSSPARARSPRQGNWRRRLLRAGPNSFPACLPWPSLPPCGLSRARQPSCSRGLGSFRPPRAGARTKAVLSLRRRESWPPRARRSERSSRSNVRWSADHRFAPWHGPRS